MHDIDQRDNQIYELNNIKDWQLITTNLHRLSGRSFEVAVIPVGAIEAHNRHLPEGQDFLHTTYVAEKSTDIAWRKCPSIICLPTIPYGVDCNQIDYPLAIHVSQSTIDAMVREIIISMTKHGISKIVIINGHGGNDFLPLVRQIQTEMDVYVFLCNWWTVGQDCYDDYFSEKDDHAGQMETSVALHLYPKLVELEVAGNGKTRDFRFEALQKGWIKTSRDFSKLNDHCACGVPHGANAEDGKKYLKLIIERISSFLVQLAQDTTDETFPLMP